MDILVGIHIAGDFIGGEYTCAKISLNDTDIKHIFQLSRKSKNHQTISEYGHYGSCELGDSDLDLEQPDRFYLDIAQLSDEESQQVVFATVEDGAKADVVQLCVDEEDFWFEGQFKHTDVRWETRMIPLSFLPQQLRPAARQVQSGSAPKADLNMTAEQMNAIHEKIARGVSHGLNAREIEATFQRHVTKAQLIRCMIELIERSH
jgi:hypothetical protein